MVFGDRLVWYVVFGDRLVFLHVGLPVGVVCWVLWLLVGLV